MTSLKQSPLLKGFPLILLLTGIIARIAPLFNQSSRLFFQYPSEDGYYMLTIARNIALGLGMTVSQGTIPTNGIQPLTTFLWALCFKIVNANPFWGLVLIQTLQTTFALLTTILLYQLAKKIFQPLTNAPYKAALIATLWFTGPIAVRQTQGCLETGPLTLLVMLYVLTYLKFQKTKGINYTQSLILGSFLGLLFWIRNDTVFLIFATCLAMTYPYFKKNWHSLYPKLLQTTIITTTSFLIALPWMIYNKLNFGSIVPISGISEALGSTFAANINSATVALTRSVIISFPIRYEIQENLILFLFCALFLILFFYQFLKLRPTLTKQTQQLIHLISIYTLGLSIFYSCFFFPGFFLNRYLFPLSPYIALTTGYLLGSKFSHLNIYKKQAFATLLVVLTLTLNLRLYYKGPINNGNIQVVQWIQKNVPKNTWIASSGCSGTLSFFHDRTINLDGKVNPHALKALLEKKLVPYILNQPILFIAEKNTAVFWNKHPQLNDSFFTVINDPSQQIRVMQRK